jgi:hypothetical protein
VVQVAPHEERHVIRRGELGQVRVQEHLGVAAQVTNLKAKA